MADKGISSSASSSSQSRGARSLLAKVTQAAIVAVALALLLDVSSVLAFIPCCVEKAYAQSPLGDTQVSVSLGFHKSYKAGGKTYTHSGIDIPASAGESILAPCSGTVSFVGDVPSGDAALGKKTDGKTMLAVSVTMADGRTVTLMPFKASSVSQGEVVEVGQAVGTLAKTGDRSSKSTHLHMGLKRNGVYYDPSVLLGLAKGKSSDDEASSSSSSAQEALGTSSMQAQQALEETPSAKTRQSQSATESSASEPNLGTISSGAITWSPAVDQSEDSFFASLGSAFCDVSERCALQAEGLFQGLNSFATETGIPLLVLIVAAATLLALVLAVIIYAAVVAARRLKRLLKENQNAPLCGRNRGDSIHKLFPAPGTTFITRGR